MTPNRPNRMQAKAHIMKAMAHASRLTILDALSRGDMCVADITSLVDADMSTVSKHLAVLRNAGLVRADRRGAQVFYSLRTPCVMNFFDCLESVLEANAQEQIDLVARA